MNARVCLLGLVLSGWPALVRGQDAVRLVETFGPGATYHVQCRVAIDGTLTPPAEKGKTPQTIKQTGRSKIEYDERILKENAQKQVERTVRHYDELDFDRTTNGEKQQGSLRREVSRLVILRHHHYEVPFAPAGPLTLGEIDLVRTDVFVPALRGLLPAQAVRVGATWRAEGEAVQELTDLEQVTSGGLTCTLDSVGTVVGRRQARVSFQGTVQGIGEDGAAVHQLDGYLYFDLEGNYLAYVYLRGARALPGPSGQNGGKIEGSFTLTRTPLPSSPALSDAALRGLVLEPNDDNTQLLFDNPEMGLRFLYPRSWHVAGTNPRQLGLDHKGGSGLMLVIDPGPPAPGAAEQFHQSVLKGWAREKARVERAEAPRKLQAGLSSFRLDVVAGQRTLAMQYYVLQEPTGTVTITATLQPRDVATLGREVERIARSVQIGTPK